MSSHNGDSRNSPDENKFVASILSDNSIFKKKSSNKSKEDGCVTPERRSLMRKDNVFLSVESLMVNQNSDIIGTVKNSLTLSLINIDPVSRYSNKLLKSSFNQHKLDGKKHLLKTTDVMIKEHSSQITSDIFDIIIETFKSNCLRKTASCKNTDELPNMKSDGIVQETNAALFSDPHWCYVKYIYDIFLTVIHNPSFTVKYAKKYFTYDFLMSICNRIKCQNQYERRCIKVLLYKLYANFVPIRQRLRSVFANFLICEMMSNEHHIGVLEILEILDTIVAGFNLPFKSDSLNLLYDCLIPLYSTSDVYIYDKPLGSCIKSYVEKDPMLSGRVIKLLLRYLSPVNTDKTILIMTLIDDILEMTHHSLIKENTVMEVLESLVINQQTGKFIISEMVLSMIQNIYIESLLRKLSLDNFIKFIGTILINTSHHWSENIRSMSSMACSNLSLSYLDANSKTINRRTFRKKLSTFKAEMKAKDEHIEEFWKGIEEKAAKNNYESTFEE